MNTAATVIVFLIELIVWLLSIALGSYLGGVSIGFAGALTVGILCYGFQEPVGEIPWDVLQIILSVVCLSAAVQAAGGMEYLVLLSERILRSQPRYVTFLAPFVVWTLTIVCGTGYIFFAILPVVAEVAKSVGIRPSRPLTTASLAAMFGVIASPLSSAMVIISESANDRGYSYLQLVGIFLPSTFIALFFTSMIVSRMGKDLWDDEEFLQRYKAGLVKGVGGKPESLRGDNNTENYSSKEADLIAAELVKELTAVEEGLGGATEEEGANLTPQSSGDSVKDLIMVHNAPRGSAQNLRKGARTSVLIFVVGMVGAMTYAIIYSRLNTKQEMPTNIGQGIVIFTLTTSLVISLVCDVSADAIIHAPLFTSGITAAISVLGIAWAGSTLVESHMDQITEVASEWIKSQSWIVALVCFCMASLMMSQAAAAKVFIPTAFAIGVSAYECVIAYSCCAAVFLLPASPAIVSAVSLDDCGTTKSGRYVFDHTMMIPGLINTVFTTGLVALLALAIRGD